MHAFVNRLVCCHRHLVSLAVFRNSNFHHDQFCKLIGPKCVGVIFLLLHYWVAYEAGQLNRFCFVRSHLIDQLTRHSMYHVVALCVLSATQHLVTMLWFSSWLWQTDQPCLCFVLPNQKIMTACSCWLPCRGTCFRGSCRRTTCAWLPGCGVCCRFCFGCGCRWTDCPHVLGAGNAGTGFKCMYIGNAPCWSFLFVLCPSTALVGVVVCCPVWWICLCVSSSTPYTSLKYVCCSREWTAAIDLLYAWCGWLIWRADGESTDANRAAAAMPSWFALCM